ncbi:hypothetical protein OFC18_30980, partial [Escherichia coli]|nr:hypothetical protein [Escherichia coli]
GDGSGFAYYERGERERSWWAHRAGVETVRAPVSAGGQVVGTLVLRADRSVVWADVAKFLMGGLGISAIALGLSLIASRRLRARVRA